MENPIPDLLTVTQLPHEEFRLCWERIVGAEDIKRDVITMMRTHLTPDLFLSWLMQQSLQTIPVLKGRMLFEGAPGTGKTIMAKACANQYAIANGKTYFAELGTVRDKFEGQSSKNIQKVYKYLKELSQEAPVIFFVDEIDSVGQHRNTEQMHDTIRDMIAVFIKMMNNIDSTKIYTIAATNLLGRVDHAVRRRFDDVIKFHRPSMEDRVKLFEHLLKGTKLSQYVFTVFAKRSEAYTHDDITKAVNRGVLKAFSNNEPLTPRHILEAIKKIKPTGDYDEQ